MHIVLMIKKITGYILPLILVYKIFGWGSNEVKVLMDTIGYLQSEYFRQEVLYFCISYIFSYILTSDSIKLLTTYYAVIFVLVILFLFYNIGFRYVNLQEVLNYISVFLSGILCSVLLVVFYKKLKGY